MTDKPETETHTVEMRVAVMRSGAADSELTAIIHCAECGTSEEFSMKLVHAPVAVESLLAILASEHVEIEKSTSLQLEGDACRPRTHAQAARSLKWAITGARCAARKPRTSVRKSEPCSSQSGSANCPRLISQ